MQLEKGAEPNALKLVTSGLHDKVNELIQSTSQEPELAGIDLTSWIDGNKNAPVPTQISALQLIIKYKLDPFSEEIAIAQVNGRWQSYVTVDGCIKLMNQHPAFMGVSFRESPDLERGIPLWMECTIYRSDRAYPVCVREYFTELVTDHEAWKTLPRRMLRHRTLQQASRLAFGIRGSVSELKIDQESKKDDPRLNNVEGDLRSPDLHQDAQSKNKLQRSNELRIMLMKGGG